MPIVKSRSLFAAVRPLSPQAKPTAVISAPVRLSGRRHHANRPVPMNDQPTSTPSAAVTPRSCTWSLSATR
jgi:hypothetical protein